MGSAYDAPYLVVAAPAAHVSPGVPVLFPADSAGGTLEDAVTPCDCGSCQRCRQRRYWATWREAHPEYRRPPKPKRVYVHPTAARMDRIADAVWARFAADWYYAPASERFRGWGPTAGVMRVETL